MRNILTNILTFPGNAALDDSYFIKIKMTGMFIYLVISNAIVTCILVFPGNARLNVSATTLTFILAVPGTSDLNAEQTSLIFFWLFKVCRVEQFVCSVLCV